MRLTNALKAWGTSQFNDVLKKEVEGLPVEQLPLQQGLSSSNYVLSDARNAMIITVAETAQVIRAKVGVFYSGILSGCSCADDPTPVEAQSEYCEVLLEIDKTTAETIATLVAEQA